MVVASSSPAFHFSLQLLNAVLYEFVKGPLRGLVGDGLGLVLAEELDGGVALHVVGLACLALLVHVDCAHPHYSIQYLSGLLVFGGGFFAVSAPGSYVMVELP